MGKILRLLVCLSFFWGATACGQQTENITWKEEVLLHDGKTFVVTRSVTVGGVRREPGARMLGESKYTMNFAAPDGREISWESPRKLRPMILDFDNGIPYLATSPAMVSDYFDFGCPEPAYVFLKYENGWQRIKFVEFPNAFRNTNLSPSTEARLESAKTGAINVDQVRQLVKELSKYYRVIDPNRHSPDPCEKYPRSPYNNNAK